MTITTALLPREPARRRLLRSAPLIAAVATVSLVATSCSEFVGIPGVNCTLTPANSFWRANVTQAPTHTSSSTWINSLGSTRGAKADFGSGLWEGGPIGIPYDVVAGSAPKRTITFDYDEDSDHVGYPIPNPPTVEGGMASDGDRHVLMVDKDNCRLYETYSTYPDANNSWTSGITAGSGATWDMTSNAMRTATWTSADAAGLPILPGLVRYDEVASGKVLHAIRMTVPTTHRSYVWPASHQAGSTNSTSFPPMGAWLRVKANVDINRFDPYIRPIIVALKTYGAVIADNGSSFYFSGVPDERWDNDKLQLMNVLKGADFEFINASSLQVAPNSYQATTAQ